MSEKCFRLQIERDLSFKFERCGSGGSSSHRGHITTPAAKAGILTLEYSDWMHQRCFFQSCRSLETGLQPFIVLTSNDEDDGFPSNLMKARAAVIGELKMKLAMCNKADVTSGVHSFMNERRALTINEERRSVRAQVTTESPVMVFDFEMGMPITEVLLNSGVTLPRQVPLLDSHARESLDQMIGSVRDFRKVEGGIDGLLIFSETPEGDRAFIKVREGHATDVSAGYNNQEKTFVRPGETATIRGQLFEGPVNVVTKWRLREVSVVAIGADADAKIRACV